jgi:hypothetical protein
VLSSATLINDSVAGTCFSNTTISTLYSFPFVFY